MPSSNPEPARKARILIVDDHPVVREGLTARISSQPDMEVCGEAEGVEQAVAEIRAKRPDLAIVDISLGREHGVDLIRQIKGLDKSVKVLVLSMHDEFVYAERALRAGAMGYICKLASREEVLVAIRTVLRGNRYLSSNMQELFVARSIGEGPTQQASIAGTLTDRELEIFRLIGQGVSTKAIARRLSLSRHTIDAHRENIKRKLQLKNGSELNRAAIEWVLNID
jgi:DNA-binding NarL/FixJ family response regulator